MAGKLHKIGESCSLDSNSSKQALFCAPLEKWHVRQTQCQLIDTACELPASTGRYLEMPLLYLSVRLAASAPQKSGMKDDRAVVMQS